MSEPINFSWCKKTEEDEIIVQDEEVVDKTATNDGLERHKLAIKLSFWKDAYITTLSLGKKPNDCRFIASCAVDDLEDLDDWWVV